MVRAFADRQAGAANAARDRLAGLWAASGSRGDRITSLSTVYSELVNWRYELAAKAADRLGPGIGYTPERFRTPITPETINYDRLGSIGRFREGAEWDAPSRTYTGGVSTPAYEAMVRYGHAAEARFEAEAIASDILQNWVTLPDGTRVPGNRIIRGDAARDIAQELAARVSARGIDASQMETGGDPIYTATPSPQDSTTLHTAALSLLADPHLTAEGYLTARYLLFQSPQTKKGSDAVNRTFAVAVGALALSEEAPGLPADIDLRCYVLGQTAATR